MEETTKVCTRCQQDLPLSEYYRDKRAKDGRVGHCRACASIKNAAAHQKHLEKRKAAALERRKKNRLELARLSREWRQANPERFREYSAAYRAANPEKVAARLARWHAANPEKVRAHRVARKGLERASTIVTFTGEQLAARLAYYGNRCWMCRGPFEHLDHVKPLSKGGSHILANFRPACERCNLSKAARWYGPRELHRFIRVNRGAALSAA